VMFLVNDREQRRNEVVREVSSKWASAQTVTGPFLSIPYFSEQKNGSNPVIQQKRYLYLLPDELSVNGKIISQIRHRSIFKVPVYTSNIELSGKFTPLKTDKVAVP